MKKLTLLLFLCLSVSFIFAENVNLTTAQLVGKNFYYQRVNQVDEIGYSKIHLSLAYIQKDEAEENLFYVFNVNDNEGFIIVSADDVAIPVIGYSFTGSYTESNLPEAYRFQMEYNQRQIKYAKKENLKAHNDTKEKWESLISYSPTKGIKDVMTIEPFILTRWNQSGHYNELCPEDSDASNGRVPVGCVAVAMAQAMKYYDYPETGQGSNSYYYWWGWPYGTLSANFGSTTYHWDEMPNHVADPNDAVATLMYHLGVAIEMHYGPDGSGADVGTAADKMVDNFRYSSSINHVHRGYYTDANWHALMRNELDSRRPIIYSGSPESGSGHAWNVDGYQGDDYFHQNFGWGGAMDGYYYFDNIVINTTGGGEPLSLTYYQDAIINIIPSSGYPEGCSGTNVVDGYTGTFSDGSGHQNYQNNRNCFWLIQPDCGSYTTMSFDVFDLEEDDAVYIYDGTTTSDPLLAVYYGGDYTETLVNSGNGMLINFVTDGSGSGTGWTISYETSYCMAERLLTDESGTFNDGSGTCDYLPTSFCRWRIEPEYAVSVTLDFTYFDLYDDLDYVKIYKNDLSTLVVKYDTDNLPTTPLEVDAGLVFVKFFSDADNQAGGWQCTYNALINEVSENETDPEFNVYPNPFNTDAQIAYSLVENSNVTISVNNIIGETIGTYQTIQNKGNYSVNLSDIAADMNAGVYFINLSIDNKVFTKKVICYK